MEEQVHTEETGSVKRVSDFAGEATATVLGAGYCPVAPGTAGSMVASVLFFVLVPSVPLAWGLCGLFLILGYWGCSWGRREWGKDPSRVVVDELAGCWIAMLALTDRGSLAGIAAAFVLFRLFDIFKPWPVSIFDRMDSAAGILLDDVAAGIMAALTLRAGLYLHGLL